MGNKRLLTSLYEHLSNKRLLTSLYEHLSNKANAHVTTTIGLACLNAGLQARSHYALGRSCDRPNRSRFSMVFSIVQKNAELIPKFHIALHT
jgi:hypothetical protein